MYPTPNRFRDRVISMCIFKIVDKKVILRTVSSTDIYCSSDKLVQLTQYNTVAYLPHARKVKPQNRRFLSNTRTNNGTAGLRKPFLGYGSVNTLPRRRMTSHSNNTGWKSRDLSTARYSWHNNRTGFSVRGRCGGYITRLW
jgi:hypothetical protein